tara:strand:+ start:259 stop:1284 length:1026 start_codon:yes stop_codon:yes gene_type:complete
MNKKALITGITGQDGAYLAKFLISKNYEVYGTFRRTSSPNFGRLRTLGIFDDITFVPFDLLDQSSIISALDDIKPNEIYNLAAQSFVGASFEQPIATGEITGLGLTRVLDSMRTIVPEARFYQASSSEMFGGSSKPLSEDSLFNPRSPYAAAKVYAHNITKNYREAYDLFACSGILFNHESPIRGLEFVTRKITFAAAAIKLGLKKSISLGNINARRDWGFAGDYVQAMWLMLQQDEPKDYVIATGKSHSVEDFGELAFKSLDLNFKDYLVIDKKFYRPTEVDELIGNPSSAIKELGWNPSKTSFKELVKMMVMSDYNYLSQNSDIDLDLESIKEVPHFKE